MALSHKLAQFNQQQEKLQASLASIPANRPTRKPSANDIEKLRQITTIQNWPAAAQMKRVLDLLLETRQSLLPEEIKNLCFVDVKHNEELLESLKSNGKISFDGQRFTYKSRHELKSKEELLVLLREQRDGVPMNDLEDSYPGIARDVQELKASGQVWVLTNIDSQKDIVYPNDPKIVIKVDDDLKQLIRGMEIPREFTDC